MSIDMKSPANNSALPSEPSSHSHPQAPERGVVVEPIAIVGIGCRLPGGVASPDDFWDLLKGGIDAISEVPSSRYNIQKFYDPDETKAGKTVSKWGGFVDQQIDMFDADFFGFSPREASCLDPLQRWLLEVSWEAFEDAGQRPEALRGSNVGVFIGAFTLDYNIMQLSEANRATIEAHTGTGGAMTMLSARLSYHYDLRGPSLALDTACSSSMVAVHLACQSIWSGESRMALAGGVNAMFMPEYTITNGKAGMLSPDGRCKSFDAAANGYVRAEGAAIVLLKPLSVALAEGDRIYAVIRSTACNQDGHSEGITVPSGDAQEAAMREACRRAGVVGGELQYVEAHGTGTLIGDPIEVNALAKVLSESRPAGEKCLIGSVKSNIGHTESVAGVASLIKVALCLKHGEIPASLHFKTPNPKIPFDTLGVEVITKHRSWPTTVRPKLAGINCFGFGGTNTHVILAEAPNEAVNAASVSNVTTRLNILPLSAKTPSALRQHASDMHKYLAQCDESQVTAICRDVAQRRTHHATRTALVGDSRDELLAVLDALVHGDRKLIATSPENCRPVFVFSGMGPQWWAMGRQLLESNAIFRRIVEEVDEHFIPLASRSIVEELLKDENVSEMEETEVSQPANFAIQVGLLGLFAHYGIRPSAVVGHSAGEPAAAYAAGVYTLCEATRIIFHRSRLQQRTSGQGGMLAAAVTHEIANDLISGYGGRVSVAAINGLNSVTLGGDIDCLNGLAKSLQEQGIFCRHLPVKVPYHTHFMAPLEQELLASLCSSEYHAEVLPIYSTTTGGRLAGKYFDASYWWDNVRNPVLFHRALMALINDGYRDFVELGPHPVLRSAIKDALDEAEVEGLVLSSLRRTGDDERNILQTIGELYSNGYEIDWQPANMPQVFSGFPCYPWQRERYWKESDSSIDYRLRDPAHPLISRRIHAQTPTWELDVDLFRLAYLADHRIQGNVVFPGAAYVELAWAAGRQAFGDGANAMSIEFKHALYVGAGEVPRLYVSFAQDSGTFTMWTQSTSQATKTIHATGAIWRQQRSLPTGWDNPTDIAARCRNRFSSAVCYRQFARLGLEYAPNFQGLAWLHQGEMEAVAALSIAPQIESEAPAYTIHPAVLDQCFQVLAAALPFPADHEESKVYMPVSVAEGFVHAAPTSGMTVLSRITDHTDEYLKGDILVVDKQGAVVVEIRGCKAVRLDQGISSGVRDLEQGLYHVAWRDVSTDIATNTVPDLAEHVLIFADAAGLGEHLAELLSAQGRPHTLVLRGEKQSTMLHRHYLQETGGTTLEKTLTIIAGQHPSAIKLVYLWGLDADTEADRTTPAPERARVACEQLLVTMQAVEKKLNAVPVRTFVVTRGSQLVTNDVTQVLSLVQTSLWGLGRVMGHQEYADQWGRLIDLCPAAPSAEARQLHEELDLATDEDQVALRQNSRYVMRLQPLAQTRGQLPAKFHPDAAYLITGGLGSLGLLVAEWMAQRGARHLVLVGRSTLPKRGDWAGVTASHPRYEAIRVLQRLEAIGINIELIVADVANEPELRSLLALRVAAGHPVIRGVVHSAGVAKPMLLNSMTTEHLHEIFLPKADGAWALHGALAESALDFFVLFSSVASVVTSPGQGAYAAANAFLDGLAYWRLAQGLPATSINWGPWGEVGMATQFDDLKTYFENRGMFPMRSTRGIEALERIMGRNDAQVLVMGADWRKVYESNYPPGIRPAFLQELSAEDGVADVGQLQDSAAAADTFLQEILPTTALAERSTLMANFLLDLAASVLRLGPEQRASLSPEKPFVQLGLDSMMAIELKNLIAKRLQTPIAVVDLLNGSACLVLAEKLVAQLGLQEKYSDEVPPVEPELGLISE